MSSDDDLPVPPKSPRIVDPHNVHVVFTDHIISGGVFEGVLNVALGTVDHSRKEPGEELAHVVVSSRLRMSVPFATRLYHALGQTLGIPSPSLDGGSAGLSDAKNKMN